MSVGFAARMSQAVSHSAAAAAALRKSTRPASTNVPLATAGAARGHTRRSALSHNITDADLADEFNLHSPHVNHGRDSASAGRGRRSGAPGRNHNGDHFSEEDRRAQEEIRRQKNCIKHSLSTLELHERGLNIIKTSQKWYAGCNSLSGSLELIELTLQQLH